MKKIHLSAFLLVALFLLLPHPAHAAFFGPIVPPECNCTSAISNTVNGVTVTAVSSAPAWGCVLQTIQNIMQFIVTLATVIITVLIALAGFAYMTSGGNAEKRSLANRRLLNAVIGLVIVLCAYLLIDSLMKVLYNSKDFGPWNKILVATSGSDCLAPQPTAPLPGLNPLNATSNATAPAVTQNPVAVAATPAAGDIPGKICTAANAYIGTNTSAGPDGGNKACAWSVNNVLANAGISAIGSTQVQGMENALKSGRGTAISQSSAVCGDIVIEAGDEHVGICLNSGCTSVISNSSSKATFTWKSGPDFAPSYSNGIGRFYLVTN